MGFQGLVVVRRVGGRVVRPRPESGRLGGGGPVGAGGCGGGRRLDDVGAGVVGISSCRL